MSRGFFGFIRSNILGFVAIFIALAGAAYAVTIAPKNSVVSQSIKNGQVRRADLARPAAWHKIKPAALTENLCGTPDNTAVFCGIGQPGPVNWVSWTNFGPPFATAGFYKDELGVVHLKGLVSSPNSSFSSDTPITSEIFQLPASYAPKHQRVFPIVGSNGSGLEVAQGRVDVQTDGEVIFIQDCTAGNAQCSAAGGYVTLDGISFRRDG